MTTAGSLHSYSVKTKISVLYACNKDAVHIPSLNLHKGWDENCVNLLPRDGTGQQLQGRVQFSVSWKSLGSFWVLYGMHVTQHHAVLLRNTIVNRSVENTYLADLAWNWPKYG